MSPVITYSRNVFLPLTFVCRNACGYCIFRRPPGEGCVLSPEEVMRILKRGAEAGCTEALFTFGEHPEEVAGFMPFLERYGYSSILEYCHNMAEEALRLGLLPHTNAGIMTADEMRYLSDVNASMGLMLETTADIPAHRNCPGKVPSRRIAMIEDAGRLKIPFTTGILLGIGETIADRRESLEVIAALHRKYGHIQEIIIQNFCPKPGTDMSSFPGATLQDMQDTVRMAKEILPSDIAIQIPPNLADAAEILPCGVTDLGGISPVTIDYVNPEHPWPAFDELVTLTAGYTLRERLCIYPQYIRKGWFHERLGDRIICLENKIHTRGTFVIPAEPLYKGKAKSVFASENPDELIVVFRNDMTAFNGVKHDQFTDKGKLNATASEFFMKMLESEGIPTHYIRMNSPDTMIVRRLTMIPLEVIVRNVAAGSMTKKYPVTEGTVLDWPIVTTDYKDDERGDPMINDDLIQVLHILNADELKQVKEMALRVNTVLSRFFDECGIRLVDFKLEFGKAGGKIFLGDEVSMDSMRLWDKKTGESFDKDVYRFDKGDVITAYRNVLNRIIPGAGV
ncbi:7,8-didemethyl-8-hydroxy-5-deazariboflavin synthase CofG [Methanospirillum stamsii]|uniref:7,8-didemethyl-8-hydroxy-5-deazariboflavin synthase CofG n=1 Tax=Methanospirillum stamsii TaxID=1277351 RepID=UPI00268BDBF1